MSGSFRTDRPPRASNVWIREEVPAPQPYSAGLAGERPVYGERVLAREGRHWRRWDPRRSKLSAALVLGWTQPLPRDGQRWLYLGAASGTTASHVADLVGVRGVVFAIERSVRPFGRLIATAESYPNLLPVLADARAPRTYSGDVLPVDGIYLDVAQPDQVEIATANAEWFLRPGGSVVLALKTASLARTVDPAAEARKAASTLARFGRPAPILDLARFHRRHFLVGVGPDGGPATEQVGFNRPRASPAGRRWSPHPRREGRAPDRRSVRGTGRSRPRPGPL